MLNVSRQVGGVIGVAILGTLVGNQQTFLPGMHLAFVITGVLLLLALGAALVFVSTRRETSQVETAPKSRRTTRPAEMALGRK
jgi:DHA2 family methylenomycin A resistance protein-like MFS transporter